MKNLESYNLRFCFLLNSIEWECSLGSLWASSVDTSSGHSGTPAVQHSSYFESGAIRNPYCFWKISWNRCFSLAVPGIYTGILGFAALRNIASQSVEIVNVFEIVVHFLLNFLVAMLNVIFFDLVNTVLTLKWFWKYQYGFMPQRSHWLHLFFINTGFLTDSPVCSICFFHSVCHQ